MSHTIERPVAWGKFVSDNAEVFPSKNTLAWLHRNRDENGLSGSGSIVKVGGRWYVWPSKFWAWFAAGQLRCD
jgi:hypothetical protein